MGAYVPVPVSVELDESRQLASRVAYRLMTGDQPEAERPAVRKVRAALRKALTALGEDLSRWGFDAAATQVRLYRVTPDGVVYVGPRMSSQRMIDTLEMIVAFRDAQRYRDIHDDLARDINPKFISGGIDQ